MSVKASFILQLVSGERAGNTYRVNTVSITHRRDYYDVRALGYIDVIAEIIRLAELGSNKVVRLYLY
ncbi:hypothetical protein K5M49_20945, partial [Serratia marcescens]|nr:hypothetical protein [Serratia marcescens]